jgi:phytoene desaturase
MAVQIADKRIVIIGSGVGGMGAAALLAKDGYRVTVLEKNEQLGGRASLLEKDGFLFDMGPSWYLMPDVFERFFKAMGATTSDFFNLVRLKPHYRIFHADGTYSEISGNLEQDKALFERIEPGSAAAFERYLAEARVKYEVSVDAILYRNFIKPWDFLAKDVRDKGRQLQVFESMERYVKRYFKTEKMQQIVLYTLVFLGGIPHNTPALYSLMAHVDFNLGVWYPEGGLIMIPRALRQLGERYGVEYRCNEPVTRIEVNDGRATVVHTTGGSYPADLVISNADYAYTETLLPPERRQFSQRYWNTRTLAPSAFILYLGVRGEIPQFVHHNIIFGPDWTKHFREIADRPGWPETPSLYVCNPSKTDPTVAPAGYENLFVLVPIASGLQETPGSRRAYGDFVLDYIEQTAGVALKDRIVVREEFSVSDFASRYHSLRGTALGLAHTLRQSSLFRPPNRSRKVSNLYFVGANTNPGIGVPMCLISAHLVRDRIESGE